MASHKIGMSNINWKQGLLRIWIVFTISWYGGSVYIVYSHYRLAFPTWHEESPIVVDAGITQVQLLGNSIYTDADYAKLYADLYASLKSDGVDVSKLNSPNEIKLNHSNILADIAAKKAARWNAFKAKEIQHGRFYLLPPILLLSVYSIFLWIRRGFINESSGIR